MLQFDTVNQIEANVARDCASCHVLFVLATLH